MFPRAEGSFLAETHMAWKYWSARPDWAGSRSFTGRHDGAIVAHAAAWPVRVCIAGQVVPAAHLIDWAADPRHPGAGFWLLRQIGAKVPVMIATGGSGITRRILPLIGFRPHGELCTFARPVRPLRQALATRPRNWTLPRLLRNTFWRLSSPLSLPRGWSVRPLAPEEVPPELWPQPSPATAVTARDTGFYRYFVDSPSARHELFGLERSGELVGYFCLAFAPHVARIADEGATCLALGAAGPEAARGRAAGAGAAAARGLEARRGVPRRRQRRAPGRRARAEAPRRPRRRRLRSQGRHRWAARRRPSLRFRRRGRGQRPGGRLPAPAPRPPPGPRRARAGSPPSFVRGQPGGPRVPRDLPGAGGPRPSLAPDERRPRLPRRARGRGGRRGDAFGGRPRGGEGGRARRRIHRRPSWRGGPGPGAHAAARAEGPPGAPAAGHYADRPWLLRPRPRRDRRHAGPRRHGPDGDPSRPRPRRLARGPVEGVTRHPHRGPRPRRGCAAHPSAPLPRGGGGRVFRRQGPASARAHPGRR